MGVIKTRGLIIKEQAYREQDKILTVFTEEEGKIQCIARGVRRQKSPLIASTQVFAYSELVYYPGKTFGNIQQAHLIESFYALRNDLNKMVLGSYLLDLMNNAYEIYQSSAEILKLLLHCLYYLSENKAQSDYLVIAAFQLKLISFLGYRPGITTCMNCEIKEELIYFDIEESGVICPKCRRSDHYTYRIDGEILRILNDLLKFPIKTLKNREEDPQLLLKIMDLLDHYIGYCLGKSSKAYSFFKDLTKQSIK